MGWASLCYLHEWVQRLPTRIFNTRILLFYFYLSGDKIAKLVFMWQAKIRIDVQWVPPPLGMNANVGGLLYIWSLSSASYWILYTVFLLSDWHLKRTTLTAKLSRGCFSHFYNSVIVRTTQTHTHTLLYKMVKTAELKAAGVLLLKSRCFSCQVCLQKPVNRGQQSDTDSC